MRHLFFFALALVVTTLLGTAGVLAQTPAPHLSSAELRAASSRVSAKSHPGSDRVVVFKGTEVTVDPSGVSTRLEQVATKVLTASGARDQKVLRFDYDPTTSDVDVANVRVLRADGTVDSVDLAGVLDFSSPKHWIYWPFRVKLLDLPPLYSGDTVVWETRFRGFQIAYLGEGDERFVPPQRGEFFDVVSMGGPLPRVREVYRISTAPGKNLSFVNANEPVFSSQATVQNKPTHTFWVDDVPAYPEEPRAMALTDSAPKVVVVTLKSWEEKSRWFYVTNEPSFSFSPEIKELAQRIVEGKDTDLDKVTALNRWVAHNIRYSGLSMGKGEGYTLHPGTMTFRDRCGVCKDKAGMLVTMMRAVGYQETYAAMTMAGGRVENIAADQFNHSVVVWRRPDGGYELLDPTWAPLSMLNWSNAEAEQHYVAGTPQGDILRITPALKAEDNALLVQIKSQVLEQGNLEASFKVSGTGYMDTCLRRWFGYNDRNKWFSNLEATAWNVSPLAAVTAASISAEEVENLDEHFEFGFELVAPSAVDGVRTKAVVFRPSSFSFPLAETRSRENLLTSKVTGRKRGINFRCAKRITYEEQVTFPDELELAGWVDIGAKNELGEVTARVRLEGRKLSVNVRADFHVRFVELDELASYEELLDAIKAIQSAHLVLIGGQRG